MDGVKLSKACFVYNHLGIFDKDPKGILSYSSARDV